MSKDWYQSRHPLRGGMVFSTVEGDVVRLVRPVAGDGTKWFVDDWGDGWCAYDSTIEPSDLVAEVVVPNNEVGEGEK